MPKSIFITVTFLSMTILSNCFGTNIFGERIFNLVNAKRSLYLSKGIFHLNKQGSAATLKGIRNSNLKSRSFERIVFDFSTTSLPSLYGSISQDKNKIYIDLYDAKIDRSLMSKQPSYKKVSHINFMDIEKNRLIAEINLKTSSEIEIFYLENPARLVVDIK